MSQIRFEQAPPLPEPLAAELPYARRIFCYRQHRIHFVDEGTGPPVLLQHGNPTWCYLWRRVIRRLIPGGVRVIAPDLIGLGLSSKPRDPAIHTLNFHAYRIAALVSALQLERVTVVGQDWGGPIVALLAARHPEWISGAVFANTLIAAPTRKPRASAFHRFANLPLVSDFCFRRLLFPVAAMGRVQGERRSIGRLEKRAYRYPLRAYRDRAAPLALARMVPLSLDHPTMEALRETDAWARAFAGPVRLVWGTRDPILGRSLKTMRALFPAARVTETAAGHFLQEEVPEALADAILDVAAH